MSYDCFISHGHGSSNSRREDREQYISNWCREYGQAVAEIEGVRMTYRHWEVVVFLRDRYLEKGDTDSAKELSEELEKQYAAEGGYKMLQELFPKDPISQGCRIAGLPVPVCNTAPSFDTDY